MTRQGGWGVRTLAISAAMAVVLVLAGAGGYVGHWLWHRDNQRETCTYMLRIGRALQSYKVREGHYPVSPPTEVSSMLPELADDADEPLVGTDAWGEPLRYQSSGDHFLLLSRGRDGDEDLSGAGGKQEGLDVDLVMFDTRYWQWASGV